MSEAHEVCQDCGERGMLWNYRGKWFVRCTSMGCRNATVGRDAPEDAWDTWDAGMRKRRVAQAYAGRMRAEARAAMEGRGSDLENSENKELTA